MCTQSGIFGMPKNLATLISACTFQKSEGVKKKLLHMSKGTAAK
jgi:hypothetical protein